MTQETPASTVPAIDWSKIGSPTCDNAAQTALQQAMGLLDAQGNRILDTQGNPVPPDYSRIVEVIPQLLVEGPDGRPHWNPSIDIATGSIQNGRYVLHPDKDKAQQPDTKFNTPEVMAVIIAVAQHAQASGVSLDSIQIQDVADAACPILNKITGVTAPTCSIGSPPRR